MKTVKIGDVVQVLDEQSVQHAALVTNVWTDGKPHAEYDETGVVQLAINVVFVTADKAKTDCYGAQTEHLSSVSHRSAAGNCPGRFWWQE